jgi:hypothetical protein
MFGFPPSAIQFAEPLPAGADAGRPPQARTIGAPGAPLPPAHPAS